MSGIGERSQFKPQGGIGPRTNPTKGFVGLIAGPSQIVELAFDPTPSLFTTAQTATASADIGPTVSGSLQVS